MGIKSLKPFLKKKCPEAFIDFSIDKLNGKKVAFDASTLIVSYWKAAYNQVIMVTDVSQYEPDIQEITKFFLLNMLSTVIRFLESYVTPIFIYDGESPTEKLNNEGLKRKANRMDAALKLAQMKQGLINIKPSDISEDTKKEMRSVYKKATSVDRDAYLTLRKLLTICGICQIQSKGEAEQLCSFLCKKNYVDLVFSRDSDCLVHGTSIWIHELGKYGSKECKIIVLNTILEKLEMTFESFIDFCILCGTDYNNNISQIGPTASLKLIQKYENIDNLPSKYGKIILNKSCLNHIKCRELFFCDSYESICDNPDYELVIDFTKYKKYGRDIFVKYGLENIYIRINEIYENYTIFFDKKNNELPFISNINSNSLINSLLKKIKLQYI